MKPPMVMPSNLRKMALQLQDLHPGRLGLLLSPFGWIPPRGIPYALDNGRYPVWSSGKTWDESEFFRNLEKSRDIRYSNPLWIAVPDVVTDASATFLEWKKWSRVLTKEYNWPLALVVQDGMEPTDVLQIKPAPEVIFVGGSTKWKWRSLRKWTRAFPRVHVGRVNTWNLLWRVHNAGAESCDGTGWYRNKQRPQLERYLKESEKDFQSHGFFKESEL